MDTKNQTLTCTDPSWQGVRLDKFIFSQFPSYSRAYFQELIKDGLVLVNDRQAKSNYKLKLADVVSVTFKNKQYNLDPHPVEFEIVHENQDFIIINKPAGLIVHSASSSPEEITLVNGLLYHFKEISAFDDKERPGIVHRLDKNTSGLMIVARNQQAQITLADMFKARRIHKTYQVLVTGTPLPKGSIDLPIGRHPTERHKMATFGVDTRNALTYYEVLEVYEDSALVAATIVTGRTHQIRVHFASQGHALVGDTVYGVPSELISRQALHAWKISFEFKGTEYAFSSPLPDDMNNLIAKKKIRKAN